ncbi:oxysterol binding protein [Annulohypoxylon maeteangense]|uniref:oxysterol binding protein n=1 Tax=Annulohypoxylon maeteangense TaxID=1927788 RepID=UPI00200749FB|nr:oxysterol binding protein [Annulohypoxylon maeteangense]KAI0886255.1 oxysterol binding protein [Annulohypoxylon maeteangense]
MSDSGDVQHKRSKSTALSLLRRRDKDRNDDDSEDGSQTSGLASTTTNSAPAIAMSHQASIKPYNQRMSLGRIPSREPNALAPTRSNNSAAEKSSSLEQSVRKFRIVEALRSGNTAAISKAIRETSENGPRASTSSLNGANVGPLDDTTILHLAIQCAEYDVVEYVLSDGSGYIDINARDKDGNVPLHIASTQGRSPIVRLLLEQKDINDAVANNQGKLPLDVARNPEIFQQLQLARTLFVQDKVKEVQDLVRTGAYDTLGHILEEPRVKTILDINSIELPCDPVTVQAGGSLLHEAARKKDTKLIQALLLHGADPFQRDRKGKLPQQVTNDDITKAMLKRSPAAVAAQRGIQEKAVLGHATSQAGASAAVSGDLLSSHEPQMKGYLKKWTNYRKGYQLRWFVLENGVLSYYKHQDDAEHACRGAISMRIARLYMSPEEKTKFEIIGKSSVKYTLKANHEVEAKRWFWALNNAIQWMKDQAKQDERQKAQSAEMLRQARDSLIKPAEPSINDSHSEVASTTERRSSAQLTRHPSTKASHSHIGLSRTSTAGSGDDEFVDVGGAEARGHSNRAPTIPGEVDDDDDDNEYMDHSSRGEAPTATKDAFNITAQSARLQLDTLASVSAALQAEAHRNPSMSLMDPRASQALSTYDAAIKSLKGLMGDLLRISKDRDAHWQYRLEQETEMRRMWEESMAKVAAEQEVLEARVSEAEAKRKMAKRALREVIGSEGRPISSDSVHPATPSAHEDEVAGILHSPSMKSIGRRSTARSHALEISDDSESEQEEFFDAVDAGEVDAEPMPPSDVVPSAGAEQDVVVSGVDVSSAFHGYENGFRTKLKLDEDNRPRIGLWGILKSMIGKDMTKMTLPVSFNEPTSLLYRTGEDMEYADLLDMAADRSDSIERMLYVAAFASSEFASTIGRVAKPFNPLLGETFEYVRPDKGYRFFIEQVSHHPPVGAAYAESARWTYWGEAKVDSRFLGKSFDIYHLGTWFLRLRPTAGGKEDFFTWKKPKSQVVGIITGNPVVDNYGLVEIKNWTTGETCLLDFKQRGWKASSAYQLSGKILDSDGRPRVSLGGRWNSKLYARLTPGFEATVEEPKDTRGSISDPSRAFIVWEANARPEGIPFNLTPFVLTFNHIDGNLEKWIAPTDSRYRPDQRAMEDGEYDLAASEKNRLEEAQRARRKIRQQSGEDFTPAWFEKATCEITGVEYWKFTEKYWVQREKFGKGDAHAWDGLEPIYTSEE